MNLKNFIAAGFVIVFAHQVFAADNKAIRKLLSHEIAKEFLKVDSEEKAWRSESEHKHEPKVAGTVVGSYTDTASSKVWLDDPDTNLDVNVKRFDLNDDTIRFSIEVKAKIKFKCSYSIKNVGSATVGGSGRTEVSFDGMMKVKNGKLEDSQVSELDARIQDLRFTADPAKPAEGLVQAAINKYLSANKRDFEKKLEKIINGTKLP